MFTEHSPPTSVTQSGSRSRTYSPFIFDVLNSAGLKFLSLCSRVYRRAADGCWRIRRTISLGKPLNILMTYCLWSILSVRVSHMAGLTTWGQSNSKYTRKYLVNFLKYSRCFCTGYAEFCLDIFSNNSSSLIFAIAPPKAVEGLITPKLKRAKSVRGFPNQSNPQKDSAQSSITNILRSRAMSIMLSISTNFPYIWATNIATVLSVIRGFSWSSLGFVLSISTSHGTTLS